MGLLRSAAIVAAAAWGILGAACGDRDAGPSTPPPSGAPSGTAGTPSGGVPAGGGGGGETAPRVRTSAPPPVVRPTLVRKQGQYFAWSMPAGWQFNETANGVDIYAPDQKSGAGVAVVFNYPGSTTPEQIIDQVTELAGIRDPRTVNEQRLPDVPGYGGIPWTVAERDFRYTYDGLKARRKATAAVQSYGNGFHAAMSYYACDAAGWKDKSTWLVAIVNSIVVTNPRQLAGLDKVTLPKNNPMDHSALSSYWRDKGLSEDRIFQGQREGMMGYEEMKSRDTGTLYQMPLETYDATRGGYRNPDNPAEMLVKPGE
ncbi:MAG: hypothetical protein HUU15_17235 [Candidatus Brocadiae bacterium]|nr:hypothetical protein [Candidatus Brocadiia bacterium]